MSARTKLLAVVFLLLALWLARLSRDYFDAASPANTAMQLHLRLVGEAIYEYHAETGRWPAGLDDLGQTSLPRKSPHWRQVAATFVILWPKEMNADPRQNGGIPLAYDKGGLFNKLGRVWVCWGDLRTVRVAEAEIGALARK